MGVVEFSDRSVMEDEEDYCQSCLTVFCCSQSNLHHPSAVGQVDMTETFQVKKLKEDFNLVRRYKQSTKKPIPPNKVI